MQPQDSFIFYSKLMKKHLQGYFKGYKEEDDSIEFIASSNAVDREGESIDPMGWDLSNIGKNLPLLWSHDARELPIGKVTEAHVEGNNLIAAVKFAHEVNDFAKKVYDLVKAGFLNAVSVGFIPKAYDNEGNMISQELLELSVVNVPANQEALRSNMYMAFCKSLDELDKEEDPKDGVKEQEEIVEKEGRIISEKNRNTMRIAIDGMKQAQDALNELLTQTEPPAKKGGVKDITPVVEKRDKRIYDLARLQDKVGEAIIAELKKGGEIK
jgi:HK97 family phage prohead protease